MDKEWQLPVVNFAKIQWTANVEAPSNDRVLLLHARGKEKPQDNKLRIVADGHLWHCSFEKGWAPEGLKQKWTKASDAVKAVKAYYANKDIEVTEE